MKCRGQIQRRTTGITIMSKNAFSKWRGTCHVSYARDVSWILSTPMWYVSKCYVKNINHTPLRSFILRTSHSSLSVLGPVSSFCSFSSLWRDLLVLQLSCLGEQRKSGSDAAVLLLTHIVASLLTHLVDVQQHPGPQLIIYLGPPSASLTPRPGA